MTKKTEAQPSMLGAPLQIADEVHILSPELELSVSTMGGIVAIWVGPPSREGFKDFGACIGAGATRQDAVTMAVQALEAAVDALQDEPPV